MKRFIAILLCVLMIVPQAVVGSLASYEAVEGFEDETPEFEFPETDGSETDGENSDDIQIVSMEVVGTMPLYENVHGDWWQYYDEETDTYVDWFYYECAKAKADVVFYYSDGTAETLNIDDIGGFSFGSDQSYENQWTVGNTYEANLFYNGENDSLIENTLSCTFTIEIVENPVESIDIIGDATFRENIDGMWATYQDGDNGEYEYYFYQPTNAIEEVCFNYKDGSSEYVQMWEMNEYTRGEWSIDYVQSAFEPWTGGNSYEVIFSYGDVSTSFWISIEGSNVERIEVVESTAVTEGTCGYYSDYETGHPEDDYYESGVYFWYDPWSIVNTIRVYYKDGSSEDLSINETAGLSMGYNQGVYDQWTVGNTYEIEIGYMGATTVHSFEILPSLVESIDILTVNDLIEGQDGWYSGYWDRDDNYYEYYFYDPNRFLDTVQVNYKDGTSEIKDIYELDGRSIWTGQNYLNQWTAGNTYQVTLWYQGVDCNFNVNVIADPIVSIELYNYRNLKAGVDGQYYTTTDENGDEQMYFFYHPSWAIDTVKVTYVDGSYEYRTLNSFDEFSWEYSQNYENPWLPGNSYPVTLCIGSHKVDFELYVEPSDIESIEIIETRDLVEGADSEVADNWVDGEWLSYTRFSVYNAVVRVRVNYKDGTSWEGYQHELGNYEISSNQSYFNQWATGNSYEATLWYKGVTCTFIVNVVEDPVESIEVVETQAIYENINGWWNSGYSEELGQEVEFFQYYPWDAIVTVKINYKDGSSKTIDYDEWRRDEDASISHNQNVNNQWTADNTYTATLHYHSVSCDFSVTILGDPIASFEIYEFDTVVEGIDGWYENLWSYERGSYSWFYYPMYNAVKSVKINYNDGSYDILSYDEWRDRSDSYLEWDQNYENQWLPGNTYTVRMGVGDHIIDVPVYITPNDIESIVPYNVSSLIDGMQQTSEDLVDDEWVNYPFFNVKNAFDQMLITYKNGETEIKYRWDISDSLYTVITDQRIFNQWQAGNTYTATFMCMGKTTQFPVTIEADPIESIEVVGTNLLYEDVNGWWTDQYSDTLGYWTTYFYYDIWQAVEFVKVNYKDGTSEVLSLNELSNKGFVSYSSNQSVDNPWLAGNTYVASITFNDVHTCEFNVQIDHRSVVDLEFPQFVSNLKEGSYGYWTSEMVDGELKNYFIYDGFYNIGWVTVYYSDGTSSEFHFSSVDVETNQSYTNQWLPGGSYPVTVTVDGYSETLYLNIEPTNVERFEILETKPIYEGDGYVNDYYDEDLGEWVSYIYYDAWSALDQIKVYYKDGTTRICSYDDLGGEIGGTVYLFSNQGLDSGDGIWTAGNTYTAFLSCGMFDDGFEITIIENPIASIEVVETRPIEENTNGWFNSYWDENHNRYEYFHYHADAAVWAIKVNYKDGTSEILNRNELNSWGSSAVQNWDNQWTVGNTYTATFQYMGHSCEFEVSIVPFSPYNYIIQDGGVYITGVKNTMYFVENNITDLVFPSEIQGYPVVGINDINADGRNVKSITVPSSVKYISVWALSNFYNTETVYIESAELEITPATFAALRSVNQFVLNAEHPDYVEIDGVIFDKDVTTIAAYPIAKGSSYELPVTISDMSFMQHYYGINFIIHPDSKEFVVENGITYDKAKTQIIACDKTVSGDYVMPETVEYIPEMMFQGCENLTSVVMSPLVTNIAYATFDNCPNLKSVVLPTELQSIGYYAFSDCTALESIELPSKLENIEYRAFYNSGLKSLTVPGNIGYIGSESFKDAKLETLVSEESTEEYGLYFGQSAFEDNANLTTVVLGEGLGGIGSYVFYNCTSLESINIPDSATMFGNCIFGNCDSLTYLPIGANQDHIPPSEFTDCDGLVDITIPDQVVAVLGSAFSECKNLKTVKMPDDLTYFESYVFSGCTSLTELPLSANQTYIAYGEFARCTGLVDVVLPERITEICGFAFSGCENLESINLSDNINYIDRGAFQGCTSLKEAYIGNKIEHIEMYTFKNSGITEVVIGENVQSIGYESFMNSKLTTLDIPSSVTYIAYFAFFGCEDLAEINMPDTLVELGGHSFGATKWYNDQPEGPVYLGSSLYNYKGDIAEGTELYVKPGTLAISGHAFESGCSDSWYWGYRYDDRYNAELYDRSGLKSIHLPEGVEIIGDHAFYNCSGLKEIYFPASLTSIYIEAFYGADNIETIYYSGTEEQWSDIVIFDGHSIFDGCEIVFNYVDENQPEEPSFEKGDIDGNDSINSVDLFKMNLFVKQITSPSDEEAAAADIDGNGKVNSIDMFYLKYRILKGEWSIK